MKPYTARATINPEIRRLLLNQKGSVEERNKILGVAFSRIKNTVIKLPNGEDIEITSSLLT